MPGPPARLRRLVPVALLAAALLAPLGWVVTDHLEARNAFCTSCHLPDGVPLHRHLRRDFEARPPATLAAAHAAAGNERRADGAFRCIDCHGGASALGRLRTKLLAAKDAFWYMVGSFEEPSAMRWPLWDEDCRRCHDRFAPPAAGAGPTAFHALAVHNTALGVDCVECHLAHEGGGNPEIHFVHAGPVRAQCARCHSEFEEEDE